MRSDSGKKQAESVAAHISAGEPFFLGKKVKNILIPTIILQVVDQNAYGLSFHFHFDVLAKTILIRL